MANTFSIKISEKKATYKYFNQKIDAHTLDLTILENLAYMAANTHKSAADISLCVDLAENVKNFDGDVFTFDDADKKNFEAGIAYSATIENGRPQEWFISKLWKQFSELKPIARGEAKEKT